MCGVGSGEKGGEMRGGTYKIVLELGINDNFHDKETETLVKSVFISKFKDFPYRIISIEKVEEQNLPFRIEED
ncbi:hypothetical protein FJZ33_02710 [Candidatus Poribacteria bacterium]|nr:hypothetical protein [Candidatus Poribacteria bacterium]